MAIQLHTRPLNKGEQYACRPSDVKSLFSDSDIYVSFGYLNRTFQFDSRDVHHPRISGNIIASVSTHFNTNSNYLSFYVIKDAKYDDEKNRVFVTEYLPEILKWLQTSIKLPETQKLGALCTNVFLIEQEADTFKKHTYHY